MYLKVQHDSLLAQKTRRIIGTTEQRFANISLFQNDL